MNNKVFIHPETFLIAQIILRNPQYNATAEFSNYFKTNGLQYPGTFKVESGNIVTVTQTSNFAINPVFPANTFEIKLAIE